MVIGDIILMGKPHVGHLSLVCLILFLCFRIRFYIYAFNRYMRDMGLVDVLDGLIEVTSVFVHDQSKYVHIGIADVTMNPVLSGNDSQGWRVIVMKRTNTDIVTANPLQSVIRI